MSVESEILRIQHNVANAYAAVAEKGGEVPLQPTSANLAAAVASIPSGGSSGEVYSTEEQRIGTWIDGKPLYRKVYSLMTPAVVGVTSIDPWFYPPANSTLVRYEGWVELDSNQGYWPLNNPSPDPQYTMTFHYWNGRIIVQANSGITSLMQNRPAIVILEYTKTTDTATTTLSAQSDATIKLANSALDLSSIQAAPVTAAAVGVEIAKMEEV